MWSLGVAWEEIRWPGRKLSGRTTAGSTAFVTALRVLPQDSEDLTQDVFLKIYGNLGSFDSTRGSFPVWIATLTRNLLVDHFRRSRQQRATDSIDAGWDDPEDGRPADRLTDSRPTPHENAATQELQKMVQEALTRISPELREAVILRDLQDLDYKEIAQVLNIPEGTSEIAH